MRNQPLVTNSVGNIGTGCELGWPPDDGDGFQHYSIILPDKGIGVLLMSNSDNAESIFGHLLKLHCFSHSGNAAGTSYGRYEGTYFRERKPQRRKERQGYAKNLNESWPLCDLAAMATQP